MNLLQIRTAFITHSGRTDLVTNLTTYPDNGANFFITAGQRVLDDLVNVGETDAVVDVALVLDDNSFEIEGIRSIKRMWIFDADEEEMTFLTPLSLHDFKVKYDQNTDTGLPLAYTIEPIRTNGQTETQIKSTKVLIGPAADASYTLKVEGRYYAHELSADTDINFWSVKYPHTLIQAALYSLERFYRNTQGMNDHMAAILRDIQGIDFDEVERDLPIRSNMADSFNERFNSPIRRTI